MFFFSVANHDAIESCQTDKHLALPTPDGYISNHIPQDTSSGSILCLWRIDAAQGQVVNITMINLQSAQPVDGKNYG